MHMSYEKAISEMHAARANLGAWVRSIFSRQRDTTADPYQRADAHLSGKAMEYLVTHGLYDEARRFLDVLEAHQASIANVQIALDIDQREAETLSALHDDDDLPEYLR
jgi:hypothetical protein